MMELYQVWVHVSRVPRPLHHFLGLWAVGSLIGTTLDVDLLALRRRGIIRILVGMADVECFHKCADEVGPCLKSDGVLRMKGYEFTFKPEPASFVPDPEFVPFIWRRKDKDDSADKGLEDGEGDDPMQGVTPSAPPAGSATDMGPIVHGSSSSTRQVPLGYAVTPMNPNPVTPRAIEIVRQGREASVGSPPGRVEATLSAPATPSGSLSQPATAILFSSLVTTSRGLLLRLCPLRWSRRCAGVRRLLGGLLLRHRLP